MSDRETKEKGVVRVDVEGETYTLAFDINAMASLEDKLSTPDRDVTFDQVVQKVLAGSVRYVRALVWAALHRHHPQMTLEDAGTWILRAGGLQAVSAKVMEAAGVAAPEKTDVEELGVAPQRPREAQAPNVRGGTGVRSISARAKRA